MWGRGPGMVAGCLFEDPGTHSRASSAHGIGQRGRARFREFLPLTLPLELSVSLAGACDIVLSPTEAMCGDNHAPLLPRKSEGSKGCPPQTGPPLEVFPSTLHGPLPNPICFHPGLSPTLPMHFTLVSFKECCPGGISPSLKRVPSQNPGEEEACTGRLRKYTPVPSLLATALQSHGAGGGVESDVCAVSTVPPGPRLWAPVK